MEFYDVVVVEYPKNRTDGRNKECAQSMCGELVSIHNFLLLHIFYNNFRSQFLKQWNGLAYPFLFQFSRSISVQHNIPKSGRKNPL